VQRPRQPVGLRLRGRGRRGGRGCEDAGNCRARGRRRSRRAGRRLRSPGAAPGTSVHRQHPRGSCSIHTRIRIQICDIPQVAVQLSRNWRPANVEGLPEVFTGGWVGYAGYDTVRYVYAGEARRR
jgi:hypothetical protein